MREAVAPKWELGFVAPVFVFILAVGPINMKDSRGTGTLGYGVRTHQRP
jgi:hypothetical protein